MEKVGFQCLIVTLCLLPSQGSPRLLRVSIAPDMQDDKIHAGAVRRSIVRQETMVDMAIAADGGFSAESDIAQGDAAKSANTTESSMHIQQRKTYPAICDARYVQEACHAIGDMRGRSSVRPFEIAEQLNADLDSVVSFLDHIGIDAQAAIAEKGTATEPVLIDCTDLCNKVVANIPSNRLPPSSDIGGRPGDDGNTVWDIDLSPDFLADIQLPDGDPELDHHEDHTKGENASSLLAQSTQFTQKKKFASQLQQSMDKVWANISNDTSAPENGTSESSEEADNAHATHAISAKDMVINVAQLFHVYPLLTQVRVASGANTSLAELGTDPRHFKGVALTLATVGEAWLTRAIANFGEHYLPPAYEKWFGPSLTRRSFGSTREGCKCKKSWCCSGGCVENYCGNPDSDPGGEWCFVDNKDCQGNNWGYCYHPSTVSKNCKCKKEWTFNGIHVNDCGNPDNDSGGPWCLVEDNSCQGTNWGYCVKPYGRSCQTIRSKLEQTKEWIQKLEFHYDASRKGAYGYVRVISSNGAAVAANRVDLAAQSYVKNGKLQTKSKSWTDTAADGDKIMYLCPAWWNQCDGWWRAVLGPPYCSSYGYGTMIGTIIHETLHHLPMGTTDYLYYRSNIPTFVIANSANEDVLDLVKNTADAIEYFVADNNGYTSTGR